MSALKLKKRDGDDLTLRLAENPDILASLSAQTAHPFLVGFAAETHDVASYAQSKLRLKGLDMIAANQVGGSLGFETAENALTLYWADGAAELPRAAKSELARQLITHVATRYRATRT
jgi:phosphopantothenoylcysteine decarboxylase/phosphopantothenate--cysteine ligase